MNSTIDRNTTTWILATSFTWPQMKVLQVLRAQYRQDRDLFGAQERAHLQFLRWLYQTGRLVP